MNALLGALNMLILLGVVLAAVWLAGADAGQFTLVWRGWEITTTAAIATIGLLITLTLAFYLGQFISWLSHLPATIRNWFRAAPPQPELPRLVEVLSLIMADDIKGATRLLDKTNPQIAEEPLEAYARLTLGLTDPTELDRWVENPHLGPYASLVKAQQAAAQNNWELARITTQKALDKFGHLPAHQILHLKALLNVGDTNRARTFLGNLRNHVPAPLYSLLDMAIKGPTSSTAAKLDDPWFTAFRLWLPTPSIVFPHVQAPTTKIR